VTVPTFSVVIPTYNVARYLPEALESVASQTSPPHEVIVCDDGSTDDFDGAVAPFVDRIRVIKKEHAGVAAARNAAVEAATGEFISFLDADDVALPHRLAAFASLATQRPELDILVTDCFLVVGGQRRGHYFTAGDVPPDDDRRAILRVCFPPCPAVRRERLLGVGGFDEAIVCSSDWDCYIRMILDGAKVGYIDEPLLEYRRRSGQITEDTVYDLTMVLAMLERYVGDARLDTAEREELAASLRMHKLMLTRALLDGRRQGARASAWRLARDRGQSGAVRAECAIAAASPMIWRAARRALEIARGARHGPATFHGRSTTTA
jgi:glycosyltransferase involved in cell wall biosynthesis